MLSPVLHPGMDSALWWASLMINANLFSMKRIASALVALASCIAALSACGKSDRGHASTGAVPSIAQTDLPVQSTPPVADSAGKKPACTPTGLWALCSVEKRLTQSGFVVRKNDSTAPQRAGFSVPPAVYTLGHSRLEVFLYPTIAAANREVAKLDTVKVAPVSGTNAWETRPMFVRSGNLIAVFLTDDPRSAERVSLALTAGAPQPATVPKLKATVSTPSR